MVLLGMLVFLQISHIVLVQAQGLLELTFRDRLALCGHDEEKVMWVPLPRPAATPWPRPPEILSPPPTNLGGLSLVAAGQRSLEAGATFWQLCHAKVARGQNDSRASCAGCHFSIVAAANHWQPTFGVVVAAAHQLGGRKDLPPPVACPVTFGSWPRKLIANI